MWRVDSADSDDYLSDADNLIHAVDVVEAYASDSRSYTFRFEKNAIGKVQMKIWVTCPPGRRPGASTTTASR